MPAMPIRMRPPRPAARAASAARAVCGAPAVAAAFAAALLLAGCASDTTVRDAPPSPEAVRARLLRLLPETLADRAGWAADVQAAFTALNIAPDAANLCAALAITEQESTFRADPPVPNLARIAREEIDRRAEKAGVPALAVRVALQLESPNGKTYGERLDAVRSERELSLLFEDFIDMVPLGKRLMAGYNPVRTGGPMQVGIAFAERQAAARGYPYPVATSIRHEVFTRRGGLYFGIAHLLDYPAAYDQMRYRFADFNAGRYASRNAAFQQALAIATGRRLDLDGDLVREGAQAGAAPGQTEAAALALAAELDMEPARIRRELERGDAADFDRSPLSNRVFALAQARDGKPLPRAIVPRIALKSPKITRNLTTAWFADRVDERHRRCLAKDAQARQASS